LIDFLNPQLRKKQKEDAPLLVETGQTFLPSPVGARQNHDSYYSCLSPAVSIRQAWGNDSPLTSVCRGIASISRDGTGWYHICLTMRNMPEQRTMRNQKSGAIFSS
jgi:hypothetical protein